MLRSYKPDQIVLAAFVNGPQPCKLTVIYKHGTLFCPLSQITWSPLKSCGMQKDFSAQIVSFLVALCFSFNPNERSRRCLATALMVVCCANLCMLMYKRDAVATNILQYSHHNALHLATSSPSEWPSSITETRR